MGCRRCPHHVRHGFLSHSGDIEFSNICGLKVKKIERDELEKNGGKKIIPEKRAGAQKFLPKAFAHSEHCFEYPFDDNFEYMGCSVYLETFKTARQKNDVIPTDFQYSEAFTGSSITDMELL